MRNASNSINLSLSIRAEIHCLLKEWSLSRRTADKEALMKSIEMKELEFEMYSEELDEARKQLKQLKKY